MLLQQRQTEAKEKISGIEVCEIVTVCVLERVCIFK